MLLRLHLPAGKVEAGLQPTNDDAGVGGLCRHSQPGGRCAGLRRLVPGKCRFLSTTHASEDIQFPTCAEIGFVRTAVTVETGARAQDFAQRRLKRLVGSGCLAADVAGRQQRGICRPKLRARLGDASGRLREIEVLLQRQRDESGQLRIAETRPPCDEIGLGSGMPLVYRWLAQVPLRHGHIGPDVVGTDSAAGREAGNNEYGKGAFGQHGLLPDQVVDEVTIIQYGHSLSISRDRGKLQTMNKATTYPVSARGPADHDVRDQIVTAATEHFSRYGYEKTTVSDLAKAIGFSKAYIYKFFESKQAIGEMICANCLREIETEVSAAIAGADTPPEKLRRMFKAMTEASLRLFFQDRKLYEIAASAATERWQAVYAYEERIQKLLRDVLQEGRQTGDFERKTPLDETALAIYLVMRPYLNPLLLQHSFDYNKEAPAHLSSLVLRSLSP